MPENDKTLLKISDLAQAAGLLSRLPLPTPLIPAARSLADTAWCWPLIGAGLATLAGLAGLAVMALGAPAGIGAGITLAAYMALTGALHEDGLADSADGLWGGQNRTRRLEIMRDSRVGSYGVLALVLSVLLRWSALVALAQSGWFLAPVIAAGALSRAPMVLLMAALPNARAAGLAAAAGRPPAATVAVALALAAGIGLWLTGWAGLAAILWISLAGITLAALAKAKIGGQTGDILGASQQLAEIAALACFAAAIT